LCGPVWAMIVRERPMLSYCVLQFSRWLII
jgi:hypothetical protein